MNQGAVSANDAFTLGSNLSVGAYQYYLFKGGVTADSENSWFLRSSVVAPAVVAGPVQPPEAPSTPEEPTPPIEPTEPVAPAIVAPVAAIGTPALPQAAPGQSIALYRLEVPAYAVVPPAAALLAQTALGTFHERQGDQSLLRQGSWAPAGWARSFGSHTRQKWSGDAAPMFDGNISGYQLGHDVTPTRAWAAIASTSGCSPARPGFGVMSKVSFDSPQYWRGRLGARLRGRYDAGGLPLQPYLRANLWRTFSGRDTVTFDDSDALKTDHAATTADLGAGLVAQVSKDVSLYLNADYSRNLDTQPQEAVRGTLGIRVDW